MTIDPANLDTQSLVSRIKSILLKPRETWDELAREPVEVDELYMRYAVPLAAFSALCLTIGLVFFPWGAGGTYVHLNAVQALFSGAVQFVSLLAMIYIMARVIDGFAPMFGAERNRAQAHKLAVFSFTAALLSGVFSLHPWFGALGILGLYTLVLLYLGLPRLMGVAEDKRGQFFAAIVGVTIAGALVLSLALGTARGALVGMTSAIMPPFGQEARAPEAQTELAVPGGSIDLRELEKQARSYGGARQDVSPARLAEFLPQTLPSGFSRTEVSSTSAPGVAQAAAQYRSGDARMTVTIARVSGADAATTLAEVGNVQENRRDADGFSSVQTINGRLYSEQVSASAGTASYAVVSRGVVLTAEGSGVTPDQLRAAVETIDMQRLENEFGN